MVAGHMHRLWPVTLNHIGRNAAELLCRAELSIAAALGKTPTDPKALRHHYGRRSAIAL